MTARAIWKAVLTFGQVRVPVKLYPAVTDRTVHFRLLHRADQAPVKQALVNPQTDEVVPYGDVHRAFLSEDGDLVMLQDEELASLDPEASREIRILQFLPPRLIDHRWYLRPYYLGPDEGGADAYFALIAALAGSGCEGVAQWVMRKKAYLGALRLHQGYPMLISLRHVEEVVAVEDLDIPAAGALDEMELGMARQLMEMLAADFEPEAYHDAYRARVEELIETKVRGGRIRTAPPAKPRRSEDLTRALQASLKRERERA
jgi:DNA end-binding protein Ku